jgi:hypothetical protein
MTLLGRIAALLAAATLTAFAATAPGADPLPPPWPLPASPPLPPDLSVPYLPGVRTICADGARSCFTDLEATLEQRTSTLGCGHDAVFSDAYLTITRGLIASVETPGFFARPDRITHEARQYAQEYLDQFDRWHRGATGSVSRPWKIAFQAAEHGSVSAMGDLLLALNAHIRRDNPIRAVEQSEGVLRIDGDMPQASGRPDHDRVSEALADNLQRMLDELAARYDPQIDDGADLFGTVLDERGLYALISSWREESWRNAEQLRHARAEGGVDGTAYRDKLAEIEASATAGAEAILTATRTTPADTARRDAYCARHQSPP